MFHVFIQLWQMMCLPVSCIWKHLVKAGIAPSPEFSEALCFAHKLRLAGVEKKDALTQTLAYLRQIGDREE